MTYTKSEVVVYITGKLQSLLSLFCLVILIGALSARTGPALAEYPAGKPSVNSGREVYISSCTGCHGENGKGQDTNGTVDFTDQEQMKNKNSSVFFDAISEGTARMPAFGSLSTQQRWDGIAYIWTFWADRQSVGRGKVIFERNCASCHGTRGDGSGLPGAFDFTNLSSMVSIGQPSVFFESVSNGVPGTAMPPFKDTLSEEERWDAVKYAWTFQYADYPGSSAAPPATPALPSGTQPAGREWYNSPAGAAILLVSLVMLAGIIYLFVRGLKER